jgi:hypothetical protein
MSGLNLDPENEQVTQFLYKIAVIYASHYPSVSLYECTTKIKKARNIIIPDGASLGLLVLKKGLEFMHEKTELIAPEPFRYVILLNDSISSIASAINLPPKVNIEKNYVIMLHVEGDKIAVDLGELDDETKNRIIDETCYRPSPFR